MDTVHLLVNTAAKNGMAAGSQAAALIRAEGINVVEVRAERAAGWTEAIDATGVPVQRLIAVGGDGTVQLAANEAARLGVPLGIVHAGTGNDFVRAVGLNNTVEAAVTAALREPHPIDLLRIGDRYVTSAAALGFAVQVNRRANHMSFPPGQAKYSVATVAEVRRLQALSITMLVDGTERRFRSTLMVFANTAYFGGGMQICPDADPTDGRISVLSVGEVGRIEMLRFLPTVFSGAHVKHPAVEQFSAERIELRVDEDVSPQAREVWGDGEPVEVAPVTIAAAPHALQLAGFRPSERA